MYSLWSPYLSTTTTSMMPSTESIGVSKAVMVFTKSLPSFILQHYWIKTPLYVYEDSDAMFSHFLKNQKDQSLIKWVREATKLTDVTVPTPAKETFAQPRLADGVHLDRAAMDTCVRNTATFLSIIVGPNDEYCRMRDSIFASMEQVSKDHLAKEREAAHRAV